MHNIINNTMGIEAAQKCGSRTIVAYAMLLQDSNVMLNNPHVFDSQGDYSDNVNFENTIFKPRYTAKLQNYQILACIVRHPIQRFLSAYTDKYMHHPHNYNNTNTTSIDEFIEMYNNLPNITPHHSTLNYTNKIDLYTDIKYHITPLTNLYGTDNSFYTHIFNLSEMNKIKNLIENLSKTKLPDLHLNQSLKHKSPTLQHHHIQWINNTFEHDIDVYNKWM